MGRKRGVLSSILSAAIITAGCALEEAKKEQEV